MRAQKVSMRSQKIRMLFRSLPVFLVISITVLSTPKAFAWTQEINNYPSSPTGCGGSSSYPCLYWPEPNHISTTLYASYDSLGSVGPAKYNFTTPVNNALGYWNSVQGAFNPYIYDCTYTGCRDVVYYTSDDIGSVNWAETNVGDFGPVQYANGQYYAILNSARTTFNTEVSWNNTLQYGALQADGRKVATHETGHIEGLGHTGYTAVMRQGAESFYQPQANDISGMQTIYTGLYPSIGR